MICVKHFLTFFTLCCTQCSLVSGSAFIHSENAVKNSCQCWESMGSKIMCDMAISQTVAMCQMIQLT